MVSCAQAQGQGGPYAIKFLAIVISCMFDVPS